jgi:phage major head subunit gpT-like protein
MLMAKCSTIKSTLMGNPQIADVLIATKIVFVMLTHAIVTFCHESNQFFFELHHYQNLPIF